MPRTSGGGAAGSLASLEARDKTLIKKRERTSEEVSIPKISVLPESQFPDPPGRRLSPWTQQNASGTDIIVGSCDEKGIFQGFMLTDVQMQTLLRYFQMAQTFMPRDAPSGLEGLAASLRNGMAAIVVTRGAFGREMDEGHGPARNAARPRIWEAVQEARVQNPNLRITCIDAPATITGVQLSKVLSQPLSDYRELAFYEGVWYTPEAKTNLNIAKQVKELSKHQNPLFHTRVAASEANTKEIDTVYNRKSFHWRNVDDQVWFKSWKQVYTDENYVRSDPPKIERDFTGATVHHGGGYSSTLDYEAECQE